MIHLEPCPFCGHELEQQHRKYNPFARCVTPDCMGGKLPLISLDVPEDIERWNRRGREQALAAHVEAMRAAWRAMRRGEMIDGESPEKTLRLLVEEDCTTSLARRDAQMKAEAFVEAGAACMHIEKGQNSLAWMHKEVAPDGEEYVGENGIPYSNKALGAQHCRDEMARLHISYLRQAESAKAGEVTE